MQPDEIYLANFPFGDAPGMKLRPVLLLTGPIGAIPELLTAYISSVVPPKLLPSDIVIDPHSPDHASSNLRVRSVIRLHKLAAIHSTCIVRKLGNLSAAIAGDVDRKLRILLNL